MTMDLDYGPEPSAEEEAAHEAWLAAMEKQCGTELVVGSAHDPYSSTCERAKGHSGKHSGSDPFGGEGYVMWQGGGYCAGDPLPTSDIVWLDADGTER
jgi:hypothetical protein